MLLPMKIELPKGMRKINLINTLKAHCALETENQVAIHQWCEGERRELLEIKYMSSQA